MYTWLHLTRRFGTLSSAAQPITYKRFAYVSGKSWWCRITHPKKLGSASHGSHFLLPNLEQRERIKQTKVAGAACKASQRNLQTPLSGTSSYLASHFTRPRYLLTAGVCRSLHTELGRRVTKLRCSERPDEPCRGHPRHTRWISKEAHNSSSARTASAHLQLWCHIDMRITRGMASVFMQTNCVLCHPCELQSPSPWLVATCGAALEIREHIAGWWWRCRRAWPWAMSRMISLQTWGC